jgi:hypothetical protein
MTGFDGTLEAGVQVFVEAHFGPAVPLAQHADHVRAAVVDLRPERSFSGMDEPTKHKGTD